MVSLAATQATGHFCMTLDADLRAVGAVRRRLAECVQQWRLIALVDDIRLLASEVLTNALVHGRNSSPIVVSMCRTAHGVLVRVQDRDPSRPPAVRTVEPDEEESGRGLLLVAALASNWGVDYGDTCKTVWFELAAEP